MHAGLCLGLSGKAGVHLSLSKDPTRVRFPLGLVNHTCSLVENSNEEFSCQSTAGKVRTHWRELGS